MKIKSNHLLTLLLVTTFAFASINPIPFTSSTIDGKDIKLPMSVGERLNWKVESSRF